MARQPQPNRGGNSPRYVLAANRGQEVRFDPTAQRWKIWTGGAYGAVVARASVLDTTTNATPAAPARARPAATPQPAPAASAAAQPTPTAAAAQPAVRPAAGNGPQPTPTPAAARPVATRISGMPAWGWGAVGLGIAALVFAISIALFPAVRSWAMSKMGWPSSVAASGYYVAEQPVEGQRQAYTPAPQVPIGGKYYQFDRPDGKTPPKPGCVKVASFDGGNTRTDRYHCPTN